eukprot:350403-Hanusia_phi.AAC.1
MLLSAFLRIIGSSLASRLPGTAARMITRTRENPESLPQCGIPYRVHSDSTCTPESVQAQASH